MTQRFSGLCVGGPKAGLRLDHFTPRFEMPQKPADDFPLFAVTSGVSNASMEIFTYTHRQFVAHEDGARIDASLWVKEGTKTSYALAELHKAYQQKAEALR